jgi:hypothetical protein
MVTGKVVAAALSTTTNGITIVNAIMIDTVSTKIATERGDRGCERFDMPLAAALPFYRANFVSFRFRLFRLLKRRR